MSTLIQSFSSDSSLNGREVALLEWRILQASRGCHFVGIDVAQNRCHASPALRDLDLVTMVGIANAGRTYRLVGLPGSTDDWLKMWTAWCVLFRQPSPTDVTAEVLRWRSHTESEARHRAEALLRHYPDHALGPLLANGSPQKDGMTPPLQYPC